MPSIIVPMCPFSDRGMCNTLFSCGQILMASLGCCLPVALASRLPPSEWINGLGRDAPTWQLDQRLGHPWHCCFMLSSGRPYPAGLLYLSPGSCVREGSQLSLHHGTYVEVCNYGAKVEQLPCSPGSWVLQGCISTQE